MKLGIIFGSKSTEHEVSVVSGSSVIKNLNKKKYDIYPIYIDKENEWYEVLDDPKKQDVYKIGELPTNIKSINNVFKYLQNMDCIIPVMHGAYGEDGAIQGLLKMLDIPYVGCGILSSSVCMDKVITKKILERAGILVTPDIYIEYDGIDFFYVLDDYSTQKVTVVDIDNLIKKEFGYPVYVKPANSGSSIGISKASNADELNVALYEAKKYDKKILIEKAIVAREIECAVLDDLVSVPGEILSATEFYSFDAKYKNSKSKTVIPAEISEEITNDIRSIAKRAFKAIDGKGLARIDFFVEKDTNKIYLNEINTMPGFTEISMYPKMIENMGISYSELLDKLIEIATK